jgi:hypothetical protein
MKKALAGLLGLAMLALAAVAQAAETPWDKWGAAPYATSSEEACRKAPMAIDGFNVPSPVKDHFRSKLGSVCNGPTVGWLPPDTKLEQMWSGGSKPHVMDNRVVAQLPVLRAPDGRPYPKGSVFETAKAFTWSFVYEGKTYVLYLPFVCFNWSWGYGTPPPEPVIKTVTVEVPAAAAPPEKKKEPDPQTPAIATKTEPAPVAKKECREAQLVVHQWDLDKISEDAKKKASPLMAAAQVRDTMHASYLPAYQVDSFSRDLGDQLLAEGLGRAKEEIEVQVLLLKLSNRAVDHDLGTFIVNGTSARIPIPPAMRVGNFTEIRWPRNNKTPAMSGGIRRSRAFESEWMPCEDLDVHGGR